MVNNKRSIFCLTRLTLLLTIIFISGRAQATTVVMLSDEDLVVSSRAIVRGKVTAIESHFDDSHTRIYSYITVEISSLLKGKIDSRRIVVRQLGGMTDDFSQIIYGAPEFRIGEQVLLYLNTADDGALRVAHLFMGKFSIQTDIKTGRQYVQRLTKDVKRLDDEGAEITNEMELGAYQEKIRRLLVEKADRVAEFEQKNNGRPLLAVPSELPGRRTESFISPQFSFMGDGFRWFEPDSGTPVIYLLNSNNAPVAGGGQKEFKDSLAAWTDIPSASIIMQSGGSTTSCGFVADGITSVSFGDCRNEIEDPVHCSGVVAIGGITAASSETKVVNGKTFRRILEGDVVFNNKFECFLGTSLSLAEVMTHELGHSIGLGHSSENVGEENSRLKDATMFFQMHADGRGASVKSDDIATAAFIYPDATNRRIATIFNFQPVSGAAGESVTITGHNLSKPESVKIGSAEATIVSSSDTEIVITIPSEATGGKIKVTAYCGKAISRKKLVIIE